MPSDSLSRWLGHLWQKCYCLGFPSLHQSEIFLTVNNLPQGLPARVGFRYFDPFSGSWQHHKGQNKSCFYHQVLTCLSSCFACLLSQGISKIVSVKCLASVACINTFTAPVCKISRLKDARTCLQTVYFSGPSASLLSMLCILVKIISHARVKKKTKRLKGFKFHTFIGHFQVIWQWKG